MNLDTKRPRPRIIERSVNGVRRFEIGTAGIAGVVLSEGKWYALTPWTDHPLAQASRDAARAFVISELEGAGFEVVPL
jgi:hypothetical protein